MACDARTSAPNGWHKHGDAYVPKVWRCGEALIGFGGPNIVLQAVREACSPTWFDGVEGGEDLGRAFRDGVRATLLERGLLVKEGDLDELPGDANGLVLRRGQIARLHADFAFTAPYLEREVVFDGIGSGGREARAALAAGIWHGERDAERLATLAAEAACRFDVYCGLPVRAYTPRGVLAMAS